MDENTRYNGWTNYETWSVALIIDNDEGLYDERRELVRAVDDQTRKEDIPDYYTPAEHIRYAVADALKDWIEGAQPDLDLFKHDVDGYPGLRYLWSQLIGAALSEVNWSELADAWLEDLAEA